MTDTMRERIARAIDTVAFENWKRRYDNEMARTGDEGEAKATADYWDERQSAFRRADAVLAAMREPTEQMLVDAGVMSGYGVEDDELSYADHDHTEWWQAMIDAAISEDKE